MTRSARTSPVFVVGASGGVGRAVVRRALAEGRGVVAHARGDAGRARIAREVDEELPIVSADLRDGEAREALVAQAFALEPALAGLVVASGAVAYERVLALSAAELEDHLAVGLVAPFVLARDFARRLAAEARGGSIVFLASTLALRPAPYTAAYAASKAALLSITRSLAVELAPTVRVNALAPGVIDTDMVRSDRPDGLDPDVRLASLAALHPLGRVATPDEIAEETLHLLDAPFTTGATHVVDGGLLVG